MRLIAGPGARPTVPPTASDYYVCAAAGEALLTYAARLLTGDMLTLEELSALGLRPARALPGWYARVLDAEACGPRARRILDATGCVLPHSALFRAQPAARTRAARGDQEELVEQAPRALRATRFRNDADLTRILNNQRELKNVSPDMTGSDVRLVQQALIDLGYTLPGFGIDGISSASTASSADAWHSTNSS